MAKVRISRPAFEDGRGYYRDSYRVSVWLPRLGHRDCYGDDAAEARMRAEALAAEYEAHYGK